MLSRNQPGESSKGSGGHSERRREYSQGYKEIRVTVLLLQFLKAWGEEENHRAKKIFDRIDPSTMSSGESRHKLSGHKETNSKGEVAV